MGCDYYRIHNTVIHFGENDEIGCLCTFPHNYGDLSKLAKETVYKLALLGAAVKLVHEDRYDEEEENWFYIPNDIPQKLKDRIAELLGGVDFRSFDDEDER